ncbi:MAG: TolC family protein [Desulfopila sp.]
MDLIRRRTWAGRAQGGLRGIVVVAVLLAGVASVAAAPQTPLEAVIEEAMSGNQDIASLAAKASALRAEAPFAGSLKDPVIGFALLNLPVDTFAFDEQPMTQKQISLSQQVPWFGKLSLAQQATELAATEQEALVTAMRLNVTRQVKDAWYELGFIERSIEINTRLRANVQQMIEVAESRYATGKGLQQDILSGQVQLSELIDRQVTLAAARERLQDTIGGLLNREGSFTGTSAPLALPDLVVFDSRTLTSEMLRLNPLIAARRAAVMRAEIEVRLAEKEYMPDMNFTVAYGQRDDLATGQDSPDFFSAQVSLTVPLWQHTRQDSKLAGAKKRLTSARRSLLALQRSLPHRVDALVAEIRSAAESQELYSQAVAMQVGQWADSSLAAYAVGKVEFTTMLSARIRQLQTTRQEEQYISQVYRKIAELEEVVGQPLVTVKERR